MIRNFRGLRLAPILMGRAMLSRLDHAVLEEAVKAWEHKHRGWEQASQGLEQVLYATLEFVYGSLATDRMRECLLYCCLFPEGRDISREQLIDYWFGEGLLDITEKAGLYIARSKGYKLLHTLLSAGLLEKGDHDEERSVKVPDSVRMMAQSLGFLTTRGNNKFVAPLKVTGDDTVPQARWASLTQ
ncbi:hypothetical protein Taro_024468, partial [Colocasia esculenta]|nr:hypothetical protein [Colocasia esculenta]